MQPASVFMRTHEFFKTNSELCTLQSLFNQQQWTPIMMLKIYERSVAIYLVIARLAS